ncbi:MAG TPA: serpin family protein [Tepidisphaeraceae bacterium]|nr:serpin family protein [Tepidisphaeraceae bacterium]
MCRRLVFGIGMVLTIGAITASASPKEVVAAAIQKLADSGDYAWRTVDADDAAPPDADFETVVPAFSQNPQTQLEGKLQPDGLVAVRVQNGDWIVNCFLENGRMAVQGERGWTSEYQLLHGQVFMPGAEEAIAHAEFLLPPAVELRELLKRIPDLRRDGDAFVGNLPEKAAIEMLEGLKRGQNDGQEWRLAQASASVKFWVTDGALSKYQVHWTFDPYICILAFGSAGPDFVYTTTIASVGKTTVRLPPTARQLLNSPSAGPPMLGHPILPAYLCDSQQNTSDDDRQLATDNNAFAIDLYSHLAATPGNLFFSPYSISSALAGAYAGARGQTAAQMRHAMHFTLSDARLHTAFAWQSDSLNAGGTQNGQILYQMSVASGIWGLAGYPYNPDFLQLLNDDYGAGFHEADFLHAAEQARADINQWVEQKTNDKIKDLIAPRMLNPLTRLVLVNAIYFKGDWEGPFDKSQTQDQPFHLDDQNSVTVPLMHRKGQYVGIDDPDLQAVILPYVGQNLDMVIVLPRKVSGLHELEQKLNYDAISSRFRLDDPGQVDVYLPRFKLDNTFLLNSVLSSMGMPDAFSDADFSGMTTAQRLQLTFVVHKAFVNVNEEGTEAAAATGWSGAGAAARREPPPPMVFRADHPFIFFIRYVNTGAILFMGRVTDPTK